MSDDGRTAPTVVALDALLVDAKLSAPPPRAGAVSRTVLIEAARASECRVVGVTAPAGYGKSTFLSQWAHAEDRRVAWVSLDRFDNDPAALLTLLASAYTRVSAGSPDLASEIGGMGVSLLGRAAPRLASAFRTSPEPFVVMLDDFHELREPTCHDVLGIVMAGIPPGSQLVAASRAEQPHLPRLRASGEALEFGARDLAFDAVGAEQIFSAANVRITAEMAATVTEQTEGWPVGLYLAALIARDNQGEVSVSGDDRYVADYLYRESLSQLREETQRFLLCTAVLDQLSAPLCDALLESTDAREQLRQLEASSTFLVPLDRRRGWYRYHTLFREFLLTELERREPDVIASLHVRAANWYEASGSPTMAVEHLLHTAERDRCIQAVTALTVPTYRAGQIATVQRWLSTLGDAAIESYPPLAVLAGWVTQLIGRSADAQHWAAIVDAASFDQPAHDGTASFNAARAAWRAFMCAAGPEHMLLDATLALGEEPVWSPSRDIALTIAGEAHLLAGDLEQAVALFRESSVSSAANANTDTLVINESELAVLAMDAERWGEVAEHLEVARKEIENHGLHDYATCILAFAASARLAVHLGDLNDARYQAMQAMRARGSLTFVLPFLAVRVRLQLAKVYWALDERATAHHLVREIDDILLHRPALGALADQVSEFRKAVSTSEHIGAVGGPPLTPAELRVLPYLQTHLKFREIGERLFVSPNTVKSQVASIYRKLGVTSRDEAVEHAAAIGLLGG